MLIKIRCAGCQCLLRCHTEARLYGDFALGVVKLWKSLVLVEFHSRTNLSGNLFPPRCENSFFRGKFVLLLDIVFMLLGLM